MNGLDEWPNTSELPSSRFYYATNSVSYQDIIATYSCSSLLFPHLKSILRMTFSKPTQAPLLAKVSPGEPFCFAASLLRRQHIQTMRMLLKRSDAEQRSYTLLLLCSYYCKMAVIFFCIRYKIYKTRLLKTVRTSYFTTLRGRYHGVQETMTTPQSLTQRTPQSLTQRTCK